MAGNLQAHSPGLNACSALVVRCVTFSKCLPSLSLSFSTMKTETRIPTLETGVNPK